MDFLKEVHILVISENFANSPPSASNFKSGSQLLEHFFLTEGQNNFGKKIQIFEVFSTNDRFID